MDTDISGGREGVERNPVVTFQYDRGLEGTLTDLKGNSDSVSRWSGRRVKTRKEREGEGRGSPTKVL